MSRRLTVLILAMVCLFFASVVVLVVFFRSATASTLEFEVAKALLQIGVVSIVGAIVSLLTFEYQRERQALDKELDQNRKNIEYREGLVKSILDRAMTAYSEVKKARRLLRVKAFVNDGMAVSAVSYDSYFDMINNAQLALENLARDIKTSAPAFRAPEALEKNVWSMEHYLGKLITEYETSRGKFQGNPSSLVLGDLPQLARFVAPAGDGEFKRALAKPFHTVQETIRAELLYPNLPIKREVHMSSSKPHWDKADGMEAWKHFAETGGNDKDRMVQVCNWLLTFSVAIGGFAFAQGVHTELVTTPRAFSILAVFGLFFSIASALVVLIYGGYANWNWAKADQIARAYNWSMLYPEDHPWTNEQKARGSLVLARLGRYLAAPADTYRHLAPIFVTYFVLSLVSAAAHLMIIILANYGGAALGK